MAARPPILVTTPNGRTGSAAARELLQLGFEVRGLVRRDDTRAAAWRRLGLDVVVGDLHDHRDLQRALAGVRRVYHCSPFDATHLHGSMLLALAAQEAGVEVVALMSGWNPHPTHPSHMQREHWMANNVFRQLPGLEVIHINPGMFAFAYLLGLPAAMHLGLLALPFGDGLNAPPSSEDIGAVAAHALARPDPWIGRCLRPMGPQRLSPRDVADVLTRVVERPVAYRDVPTWMFTKYARAMGFPMYAIAQVRRYAEELRHGVYGQVPNNHVLEVTGRAPEPFEATTRRYLAEPGRIWPGLRMGTWAGAVARSLRAALTPAPDLDAWERAQAYPLIARGELAHESAVWRAASGRGDLVLMP